MPNVDGLLTQDIVDDAMTISIAIGAWKYDDAEFHIFHPPLLCKEKAGVR
jgi:hypothetical protein